MPTETACAYFYFTLNTELNRYVTSLYQYICYCTELKMQFMLIIVNHNKQIDNFLYITPF